MLVFLHAPAREKLVILITVAGFALPVLAYFAFVHMYSVNVVVADQWSDVSLIGKAFSGHLSFSDLWAQHNENRILIPNLIVLFLGYTTHLNVRTETFLSAVLLVGSVALIIWTHRRRSPTTPLIWYCPVAILMLTWAQYENALWGFQIAWYLVMISLVGTLAVLDRKNLNGLSVAVAAVIAVIGSFSSLQGLIIWPVGFLLLLYRRRVWQVLAVWAIMAVATAGVYLYHFDHSPLGYYRINPVLHPLNVVKLFLFSLGNVAGKPLPINFFSVPNHNHPLLGSASPWIIVFGVTIFLAALTAVIKTGLRNAKDGSEALGVALILFAFAFIGLTATGRGLYGYSAVSASKYATYDILGLVGAYLVVISRHVPDRTEVRKPRRRSVDYSLRAKAIRDVRRALVLAVRVLPFVVAACIVVEAIFSYHNGLSGGRNNHNARIEAAKVIRNYRFEGNIITYIVYQNRRTTVRLIRVAEHDKLSMFAQS